MHILGTFRMQALIYGLSKTEIEHHYRLNNFPTKRFSWNIRYKQPPLLNWKLNHLLLVMNRLVLSGETWLATTRNSDCANEVLTRTVYGLMILQHRQQELPVTAETITMDLVKIRVLGWKLCGCFCFIFQCSTFSYLHFRAKINNFSSITFLHWMLPYDPTLN